MQSAISAARDLKIVLLSTEEIRLEIEEKA
jgi:hypothetical protein